ncbi:hypothetical protein LWE61_09630 [Sphingobium sufflavum]|uniref:hypothetical protein n=1 Tax=Sphingobium sufflavum TaxID=1129547 RepID=UPI001F161CE5|nr:hypothetical protein [Sphingobium sufflavum]MCE7796817.1 hypothetical protein [Sphingobium sufflavum]
MAMPLTSFVPFAVVAQGLLVLLLPALAVLAPTEGAMRTVTPRTVSLAAMVNAVIAVDGRIVAARGQDGLVVTGRRDRIVRALAPLGVLALPTVVAGCSAATKAKG